MSGFAFESYYLGLRTMRRFLRVPANIISTTFFPLIQLVVFSQLFQSFVQVPEFGGQANYLAYLAPGQIAFTAFLAVAWSGFGLLVEYRNGYLDKLRAYPINRWSILAGEMAPLFFQAAFMAGLLLIVSLLMGATIATGVGGFVLILALNGVFGVAFAGTSFIPALFSKSEQATSALSLLFFPLAYASTAFVPEALMPPWMQVVSRWNPMTYLIEAIRALMVEGYDWGAIGTALVFITVPGIVMQLATLWAFNRLAR